MRSIIHFLWKHHVGVLFCVLQSVAIMLLVTGNGLHRSRFFNTANAFSSNIYYFISQVTQYFELQEVNERLVKENAVLRARNKRAFIQLDNHGNVTINDTAYHQQYKYLGAKVVKNTVNRRNNYVLVNKGMAQGIQPGMGVITHHGVVGVVKDVSDHFAAVVSILHKDLRVSATVEKSNAFGVLSWDGRNPTKLQLEGLPNHLAIFEGDTIVSNGASAIFPGGVPIGIVEEATKQPQDDFQYIEVSLFTDFNRLSHVYIVKNIFGQELEELEEKTESW